MEEYPQPGFRFYPTEEELVSFYLHNKLEGRRGQDINRVIPVVDIYEYNPWELPQFAGERCPRDLEQWFFFIPMQEREARGGRPNRLTTEGYWKATGSPGCVYSSNNRIIGGKRTMVFYKGRAPNGRKTRWKMNEYKAIEGLEAFSSSSSSSSSLPPKLRQELSICRVYIKTKSLRAFDRRPPAELPPGKNEVSTSHRNLHALVPAGRTNSLGSSSSSVDGADEATQDSRAVENGNWDFPDISEPLWDWEHLLDWF